MAQRGGRRSIDQVRRRKIVGGDVCHSRKCLRPVVSDDIPYCVDHLSAVLSRIEHVQRGQRVAKKYGITSTDYIRMMVVQDFRCPICEEEVEQFVVDHDHKTGAVRGLLCGPCNTGLGMFKDSTRRLAMAQNYLRRPV